ncbi:MAG: methylenetetrahydrofolate--tRNA-(uracil(54)-C(5))-methyltransferase (FADH(2)-oxidizing) TrmFO [Erysipelotrichaceae bacterium]|jgi:methylenetetrahydrofolate--tRNA-(uracil-5-)-methyltransferase|nr:methylenetetrahydrofolate--tRNA-(uracil(54)-C(5))-methyltransferase (FADH(2)-oxidizing) TrmFO [Bacillota bacterium]
MIVNIIGAGLAGCEAAYQLSKRGIKVRLYEMKPKKFSDAHSNENFAELVCSNSFRSDSLLNAVGVLKAEMRLLDSLILRVADECKLPAGSALAVDREEFSRKITEEIKANPLIEVIYGEVKEIMDGPTIIATGPLTSSELYNSIQELVKDDGLYFYDAAAPIVEKDSIDFNIAYYKSRYDKGDADYINCPMNKEEFDKFYDYLINAKTAKLKEFEKEIFFEGCMPIEVMAKRGKQTLLFGPMKPVGLEKENEKRPYAVVQLRQDNVADSLYNLVGFQTHLTWPSQKELVQMIPGLENASIVRYGVMHRNTYINSPLHLNDKYQFIKKPDLFFAGQITGVEGYVESCASGLYVGINMAKYIKGEPMYDLSNETMIGALAYYVANANSDNFQPMNVNFGIVKPLHNIKKKDRKEAYGKRALEKIKEELWQEI